VKLPAGTWYDFWTGLPATSGTLNVNPALDAVPVYVRGGSILPEQPVVQNTGEVPRGPLQLSIYPGPACGGSLYQDDGNTLAYQRGDFMRMQFSCEASAASLSLKFSTPGARYKPWWSEIKFVFYGLPAKPRSLTIDDTPFSDWQYDDASQSVSLNLPAREAGEITITR
jgi:alpha-glucosidase